MRLSLRRPSARLRLTFTYTLLFVLAGVVLLGVNYFLVKQRLGNETSEHLRARIEARLHLPEHEAIAPEDLAEAHRILEQTADEVRADALRQLLVQSGIALGAVTAISAGLGWLIAGRVLRPLHRITATARRMSESRLHERIALTGPQDELKELADTFDDMLGRLDAAFDAQKHFVANASHELRTPLSIIRAELDVTLSNPEVTKAELHGMAEVVRTAVDRSERLIAGLLVLARSESGLPERQTVDLATTVRDVLGQFAARARDAGIEVRDELSTVAVLGDPVLLERLVANLVENALAYNHADGWIEIATRQTDRGVELRVANTGPVVDAGSMDVLFQPFRRLAGERTASSTSVGLGLSIVRAVSRAHGADVTAEPRPGGGLDIEVRFPTAAPASTELKQAGVP
jgi:signal transduction histidine kinase